MEHAVGDDGRLTEFDRAMIRQAVLLEVLRLCGLQDDRVVLSLSEQLSAFVIGGAATRHETCGHEDLRAAAGEDMISPGGTA